MQEKVIIFGAGQLGRKVLSMIRADKNVMCFVDNMEELWNKYVEEVKVVDPSSIDWSECSNVIIATVMGRSEIENQLREYGVPLEKIDTSYVNLPVLARNTFLHNYAQLCELYGIQGSVAEAGVFRGEFAKEINREFPNRICYLFDTFEGFPSQDIMVESQKGYTSDNAISQMSTYLADTSVERVLEKMINRDKVVIKKGYFPDTAEGINDEFCFVNCDLDLYNPTLEGLRFFYPKMVCGGVLLVHDYYSYGVYAVDKAIADYEAEIGYRLNKMPIGDGYSMAIIKPFNNK